MSIKNKDGTPYRLSRPNKLTATQIFFDRKKIILHNCHWDDVEDPSEEPELVRVKSDYKIKLKQVAVALIEDQLTPNIENVLQPPKIEEVVCESKTPENLETTQIVETTPILIQTPVKEKPKENVNSVLFHCLPAIIRQHRDNLYGDQFARLTWGKKFIFQGVVLQSDDLTIRFWTADKRLTEKSIIYPYKYKNGVPYDEYRWWQIISLTPKTGGYIYEAIPSKTQPDFSD